MKDIRNLNQFAGMKYILFGYVCRYTEPAEFDKKYKGISKNYFK